MTIVRRAAPLALVALAALAAGCGPHASGTVEGKITVHGKPLPAGLITFESEVGNRDAYSAQIQDGAFKTGPIPAGPCKITVINSTASGPPPVGGNDLSPTRAPRAGVVEVPVKYGRSDTSGLTFTVKEGTNTFDQDLTP